MQLTPTITPGPTVRRRRVARADLGPRGFTLSANKVSPQNLAKLDAAISELDAGSGGEDLATVAELAELLAQRPLTRGDCIDGPRPCPWVGCRHHMALDVSEEGSLHVTALLELAPGVDSCSLDIADRGEHTLEQIGDVLNVTRERVRQIERKGLARAADNARAFGVRADALPLLPDRDHPPEM